MKRFVMRLGAVLTLAALAVAAYADNSAVRVNGGGQARVTDYNDDEYPGNIFQIAGAVQSDGSASGTVDISFCGPFSAVWGAVSGVDFIQLKGKITAGSVASDGTVTLQGLLTETDYSHSEGVVFEGEETFEIVVDPDSGDFTLTWCALPNFLFEITQGNLTVH